ncbi:tetratricopeptide repeat protein [Virgibacillus kimchii]
MVELSPVLYDRELENLQEMLAEFAIVNYEKEIKDIYMENTLPELYDNEDLIDTYMAGLLPYIVFHETMPGTNQTIFDAFFQTQHPKIKRTRTKKIFEAWANSAPAIYEIVSVTGESPGKVLLQDVINEETFEVPVEGETEWSKGNILIAMLLPYTNNHQFLFETIEFDSMMKEKLIELAEAYIAQDGNLTEYYSDFLVEALTLLPPAKALEWSNPAHEMVAAHFSNRMNELGELEEDMIEAGVLLWYYYCQLKNPSIKKIGPYAASLEYLVRNKWGGEDYITQNQLAKDYDTNPGTISKTVRNINAVMDEKMELIMNEMEEPSEENGTLIGQNENMEDILHDIQKVMQEQDFQSEEEMNAFLDQILSSGEIPSPPSNDPRYKAREKLKEAERMKGPQYARKREKLIKEALRIHPNSPDAFLLLANDAKSFREYHHLIHQAIIAGKKDLGEEFFRENKGYFWGLPETRPFMRAKAAYGSVLHNMELVEEAASEFEEMLELNPNDNQGIRYTLLLIYMEEEQFKKAKQLMHKYEKDNAAAFKFSQALIHYMTKGMTNKTKTLLKEADKQNPYVKDYLLSKKELPEEQPAYIGIGDDSEAIAYVQEHFHLWVGEDELLDELGKL